MVSRVTQSLHRYFQGFSVLPFQGKVSRIALPALVITGFGLSIALAYRLICYLNSQGKSPDDAIALLKLSDEQYGKANPNKISDSPHIYQLDLHEIFPRTIPHSYIHALSPSSDAEQASFSQTALDKAGLIVTILSQGQFGFLAHKSDPETITSGCTAHELSIPSGSSSKPLWHLYIKSFSRDVFLGTLHQTLEAIDQFIADRGIDLTSKSLMVSSTFPSDSALFILYHQFYSHLKKLVAKESKDQTDEVIANKVLQNNDIRVLLEDRLRLIKKLLPDLIIEIHDSNAVQKYQDLVLLPMIQRMRAAPNALTRASVPNSTSASPKAPASSLTEEERIAEKLKMLDSLEQLSNVDPDKDWEKWEAFIQKMGQCHSQLIRSLDSNGSYNKICNYLDQSHMLKSLPLSLNFYRALQKALDLNKAETRYNGHLCIVIQGFIQQKVKEQGYEFFQIKEGQTVTKCCLLLIPLQALEAWYQEIGKAAQAEQVRLFLANKSADSNISSLLQPLKDLESRAQTPEQLHLLKLILAGFEKDPKAAVKIYLKKILDEVPNTTIEALIKDEKKEQQPHGPLFLLLGEYLTSDIRVYQWLNRLYQERIKTHGEQRIGEPEVLSPSLFTHVKKQLLEILSSKHHLATLLFSGVVGRCSLLSIWQQVEEGELLKAVPLIFYPQTPLFSIPRYSVLLNILEQFATDPNRITNHPEGCDLMLETLFTIRAADVKNADFPTWKQTSIWATLQQNEKLPRLQQAYKNMS